MESHLVSSPVKPSSSSCHLLLFTSNAYKGSRCNVSSPVFFHVWYQQQLRHHNNIHNIRRKPEVRSCYSCCTKARQARIRRWRCVANHCDLRIPPSLSSPPLTRCVKIWPNNHRFWNCYHLFAWFLGAWSCSEFVLSSGSCKHRKCRRHVWLDTLQRFRVFDCDLVGSPQTQQQQQQQPPSSLIKLQRFCSGL